jgi:hemin uptake protein HemP
LKAQRKCWTLDLNKSAVFLDQLISPIRTVAVQKLWGENKIDIPHNRE